MLFSRVEAILDLSYFCSPKLVILGFSPLFLAIFVVFAKLEFRHVLNLILNAKAYIPVGILLKKCISCVFGVF